MLVRGEERGGLQCITSQRSSRNNRPIPEPNRILQPIHRKKNNHLERRLPACRRLSRIRIKIQIQRDSRIRLLCAETSGGGQGRVLVADAHRPAEV